MAHSPQGQPRLTPADPPHEIRTLMGHSSLRATERYLHYRLDATAAVVAALEG